MTTQLFLKRFFLLTALVALTLPQGCGDDDPVDDPASNTNTEPQPTPEPELEKEIVAVSSIVDELMHYLVTENDCYLASKEEQDKLTEVVLAGGKLNRKCVGRDARTLLSMIGVNAPANIRCIVFEGPKEHPLITTELMMPILGVVRARDFDDAVEQAVWLEHGNRHSAHIHSKNIDNITKYAKAIDTAILVKNAPSYAALGFGGEGYCTFTIASRTGEGLTCASTFTKRRRCVMADSLCIR